jgi:hypothetical protein
MSLFPCTKSLESVYMFSFHLKMDKREQEIEGIMYGIEQMKG